MANTVYDVATGRMVNWHGGPADSSTMWDTSTVVAIMRSWSSPRLSVRLMRECPHCGAKYDAEIKTLCCGGSL